MSTHRNEYASPAVLTAKYTNHLVYDCSRVVRALLLTCTYIRCSVIMPHCDKRYAFEQYRRDYTKVPSCGKTNRTRRMVYLSLCAQGNNGAVYLAKCLHSKSRLSEAGCRCTRAYVTKGRSSCVLKQLRGPLSVRETCESAGAHARMQTRELRGG